MKNNHLLLLICFLCLSAFTHKNSDSSLETLNNAAILKTAFQQLVDQKASDLAITIAQKVDANKCQDANGVCFEVRQTKDTGGKSKFSKSTYQTIPSSNMKMIKGFFVFGGVPYPVQISADGKNITLYSGTPNFTKSKLGSLILNSNGSSAAPMVIPPYIYEWITGRPCCPDCFSAHISMGLPCWMDTFCCNFACGLILDCSQRPGGGGTIGGEGSNGGGGSGSPGQTSPQVNATNYVKDITISGGGKFKFTGNAITGSDGKGTKVCLPVDGVFHL